MNEAQEKHLEWLKNNHPDKVPEFEARMAEYDRREALSEEDRYLEDIESAIASIRQSQADRPVYTTAKRTVSKAQIKFEALAALAFVYDSTPGVLRNRHASWRLYREALDLAIEHVIENYDVEE